MSLNTTNLKQKRGGRTIKQADRSSTFKFALQDSNGALINLDGETAQVALYTLKGKYWETSTTVKGAEVSFSLPGNLADDDYILDISVAGYVFPSDRDLIIRVTQGFKNLPDKETAERSERTLEEITEDVQKKADENLKQNISDIKQISKTEADKIKTSGTEAISLIGSKKDEALKEIDSKANTIADTVKADVAGLLKDKVDKEPGKGLSDNNFSGEYKAKLDNLEKDIEEKLEPKADKTEVDDEVQRLKDLIFDSETKYQDDMVYVLDPYIEDGQVKFNPKEIGKLVANDFLRVQIDSDKYKFRIKSTSQGIILFYSMTDEDLRYAIHVYPQIRDYEIDFGKKVTGEMIFTSVTMPEDKVSVIREEGL